MSDDPNQIIENYLSLVKANLPEPIAEDVISELRDYINEAAREGGAGELTVRSAKRAVAQFGAPSEVAQEYTESMMSSESDFDILETESSKTPQEIVPSHTQKPPQVQPPQPTPTPSETPPEVETPPTIDTPTQVVEPEEVSVSVVPEEVAPIKESQPVPGVLGEVKPYSLIYLQALCLTGLVLLLTWTGLVIFRRPHFPYYLIQAPLCMVLITIQLLSWRSKGIKLHRHSEYHAEFSWFDNFTSSPYMLRLAFILTPDKKFVAPKALKFLDVFGSLLATVALLLFPFNIVMIVLLPLRALVVYLSPDEDQDIGMYILEMALSFALLFACNAQFTLIFPYFYVPPTSIFIAAILSPYLLYRIVTKSQEFWDYIFPERSMHELSTVEEVTEKAIQEELQQAPAKESYPSVLSKYIGLTVIWLLTGVITASYFIYPQLRFDVVLIAAIQFVVCSGLGVLLLLNSSRNEQQFWDVSYPEWSWLQRIATFPKNSPFTSTKTFYELDIILDIIGIFVMLGTWLVYPPFVPALALVGFLALKLYYSKKRLGFDDPISYVKKEFIANLGALILLNTVWLYAMSWRIVPWYSWVPPEAGIHAVIATPFIIFLLTISTQDLWWEHAESVEEMAESEEEPEEVIPVDLIKKNVRDAQNSTIARVFGWNIIIGASVFLSVLVSNNVYVQMMWSNLSILAAFFIFFLIASAPMLFYFKFRQFLLLRKRARSVIGLGTRAGGIIDALFSTGAICLILLVYLTPTGTRYLLDLFGGIILLSGLLMRIEAGIQQFRRPGSAESLEAMVAASILCIIGLGPLFVKVSSLYGIAPGASGPLWFYWRLWISGALFTIIILQNWMAFQLVTTQIKETGGLANLFKLEASMPGPLGDDRLYNAKKNGKESKETPEIVG